MILDYLLRLALLLPLLGLLAWGSLWLWKRVQGGLAGAARDDRLMRIVEILPLGAGGKLAVVEFAGRQWLLSVTRTHIQRIASDDRGEFDAR